MKPLTITDTLHKVISKPWTGVSFFFMPYSNWSMLIKDSCDSFIRLFNPNGSKDLKNLPNDNFYRELKNMHPHRQFQGTNCDNQASTCPNRLKHSEDISWLPTIAPSKNQRNQKMSI